MNEKTENSLPLALVPLDDHESRFIDEYVTHLDKVRAAKEAYPKCRTYSQAWAKSRDLLDDPRIKTAIKVRQEDLAARSEVSAVWIRERLKENVQRAMQAIPVLDKDGEPTGEYKYEGQVANKALELLGRHLSMFHDKLTVTVEQELNQLSSEELDRRLLAARAELEQIKLDMTPNIEDVPYTMVEQSQQSEGEE